MAVTRPSVLKWAPIVDAELSRAQVPLPRDLILAVMEIESQGYPGIRNPKSGASGLMQVMPTTLDSYNKVNPSSKVTLAELRSSSPSAAVKQIRVGLWVISHYWKKAFNYLSERLSNVPIDELAHIADLYYVAGAGATQERMNQLSLPTWAAVQASFPSWNALPHPRNVFQLIEGITWPLDAIEDWLDQKDIFKPTPKDGFILSLMGLLVAWYFLRDKGKGKGNEQKKL